MKTPREFFTKYGNFFQVHRPFIRHLPAQEVLLLGHLMNVVGMRETNEEGWFKVTVSHLEHDLGWSRKMQTKHLHGLESKGLIEFDGVGGSHRMVRIMFEEVERMILDDVVNKKRPGPGEAPVNKKRPGPGKSPGGARLVPTPAYITNKKINTSSVGVADDDSDDSFLGEQNNNLHHPEAQALAHYHCYSIRQLQPRKSKQANKNKWVAQFTKLLKTHDHDTILAALEWYRAHGNDKYTPKLWSCSVLTTKFSALLAAIERSADEDLPRDITISKSSARTAEELIQQFRMTSDQRKELPILIEQAFQSALLMFKLFRASELNMAHAMIAHLESPPSLAKDWWTRVLHWCEQKGYPGTLTKFRWSIDSERFLSWCESTIPEFDSSSKWWKGVVEQCTSQSG